MSFFDDRVFYDPAADEILVGRPDIKVGGQPWTWFVRGKKRVLRPIGAPKDLVLLSREPEMTVCDFWGSK